MEFFDTNILVYAVDPKEPLKRSVARALLKTSIERRSIVVSTQVLLEFRATVLRRNAMTMTESEGFLRQIGEQHILSTTADDVWRAFELQERFGFSIWDAMMVHAASDAACEVLYSEDMQHDQRVGTLRIVNPFRSEVHEQIPAYGVKPPLRTGIERYTTERVKEFDEGEAELGKVLKKHVKRQKKPSSR